MALRLTSSSAPWTRSSRGSRSWRAATWMPSRSARSASASPACSTQPRHRPVPLHRLNPSSGTEASASPKSPELRQSLRVPVEKLDQLAHLAPEMVVQSLKAFERHTELRRLERMLSRLRDRVREARLTPDTADLDRGAQLGEYADALDADHSPHARVSRELQRRSRPAESHHGRAAPERHRADDAAGRIGVRYISARGAGPRAHVRQRHRNYDSRARDRARQENHRADLGTAGPHDAERRGPRDRDRQPTARDSASRLPATSPSQRSSRAIEF